MNPESSNLKSSFFDDDDTSVGFPFQKPGAAFLKDLSTPAVLVTKLSREVSPHTTPVQGFYSLHGRTLAYHGKKDPTAPAEAVLNLTNSQLRVIQSDSSTPVHGFSITKNTVKHEFFAEEGQTVEIWVNALKHVCVMHNFHEEYKAVKMIGKGSFAKVYLVESKSNAKNFAVKAFTKESLVISNKTNARPSMVNEIDIMRALDHDNIIKLHEVYETERSIYLVLELIQGKSLQDILKKNGFKDNEARTMNIISSIVDALAYLASKGIMHRDLKPDNILIDKGDKVKIVDFGLATFIDVPEYIFKKCGTPGYIAPEVFKYDQKNAATNYNDRCDVFSAGCILFYMLYGFLFFDGPNASEILKTNRKFTFDFATYQTIKDELKNPNGKTSKDALDLLIKLLEFDQKKRIAASQALNHPYIANIIQQKRDNIYDVYQHGGYSPDIHNKRGSIVSEQIMQQMKNGSVTNTPQRFAEKDSLYLDVGRPELTGKIDTLTSGSNNNSLLLTKNDGGSTPNSASAFAKNSLSRSTKPGHSTAPKQSFLKAAIFRNMQKNNEMEETKDDMALNQKIQGAKSERRHSDYITTNHAQFQLAQNDAASENTSSSGSDEGDEEMEEHPQVKPNTGKATNPIKASPTKVVQSPSKRGASNFHGHEKMI